jgi:hypothetical protein
VCAAARRHSGAQGIGEKMVGARRKIGCFIKENASEAKLNMQK